MPFVEPECKLSLGCKTTKEVVKKNKDSKVIKREDPQSAEKVTNGYVMNTPL